MTRGRCGGGGIGARRPPDARESNTRSRPATTDPAKRSRGRGFPVDEGDRLDYHARFVEAGASGEPSMLNVMRDNLRHLKWVLIVVAVAMLGYLGAYFDPRAYRRSSRDWA